jgi:methionine aminopeptidase
VLKTGDVVSIALATEQNGHYGKAADTLIVGGDSLNPPIAQLIAAAQKVLNQIQSDTRDYDTLSSVTTALEATAVQAGGIPIAETGGHGIGLAHQSEPSVYNRVADIAEDAPPIAITEGLALVPMPMWTLPNKKPPLTPVGWKLAADGWTYTTTTGTSAIHVAKTIIF